MTATTTSKRRVRPPRAGGRSASPVTAPGPAPEPTEPRWQRSKALARGIAWAFLAFQVTLVLLSIIFGWLLSGPSVVLTGASMQPLLDPGDVVVSVAAPESALPAPGSIVVFAIDDRLVTHRVVEAESSSVVTKGDANPQVDSTQLDRDDILGQARLVVPWAGLPRYWLGSGHWLALGTWLGLVLGAILAVGRSTVDGPIVDEGAHA